MAAALRSYSIGQQQQPWRSDGGAFPRFLQGGLHQLPWRPEPGTWAQAQPGSWRALSGSFLGSRAAGLSSSFNRDKGASPGQRLAACLPVASIRFRVGMLDMASLCRRLLEKGTLLATVFQIIGERNSKSLNHWDTKSSPYSKLCWKPVGGVSFLLGAKNNLHPSPAPTRTAHGAFRLLPSSGTAQLWAPALFSLLSPGSWSCYLKGPHGVILNASVIFRTRVLDLFWRPRF